jgi:hypothetical protein
MHFLAPVFVQLARLRVTGVAYPVFQTVVSPATEEGPDGLFILQLPSSDSARRKDLIVVTMASKTHWEGLKSAPAVVPSKEVKKNLHTVLFSNLTATAAADSSVLTAVKRGITERTLLFVEISVCLPRLGPSVSSESSFGGNIWKVHVEASNIASTLFAVESASAFMTSLLAMLKPE